jgi:hypothetical protein
MYTLSNPFSNWWSLSARRHDTAAAVQWKYRTVPTLHAEWNSMHVFCVVVYTCRYFLRTIFASSQPLSLYLFISSFLSYVPSFLPRKGEAQSVQWLRHGLDVWGSFPCRGRHLLSSPRRPDRLWGLPSLLTNGWRWLLRPKHEADHSPPPSAEM